MRSERLTGLFGFRNTFFGQTLMVEVETVEMVSYPPYSKVTTKFRKATREEAIQLMKDLLPQ